MSTEEKVCLDPELAKAYPNAKQAVLLCNLFAEEDWRYVGVFVKKTGFEKLIPLMMRDCLETFRDNPSYGREIAVEMTTHDFERFLKAKLGMV